MRGARLEFGKFYFFPVNIIHFINLLCKNFTAEMYTNNLMPEAFILKKGTRQDSRHLFELVIELFHPKITGVNIGTSISTLNLFSYVFTGWWPRISW